MTEVQSIEDVSVALSATYEKVWDTNAEALHIDTMVEQADMMYKAIEATASHSNEVLTEHKGLEASEQLQHAKIIYFWLEEAKDYMVAWLNVIFEQYKGIVLRNDRKIGSEVLSNYKNDSGQVIHKAQAQLTRAFQNYQKVSGDRKSAVKREVRKLLGQKKPLSDL